MFNVFYQIFRPFATLFFYRNYVTKNVVDELMEEDSLLTRPQAEAQAEELIRQNKIAALDPAGRFRPGVDKIKADPSSVGEVLQGWLVKAGIAFVLYMLLIRLISGGL